MLSAVAKAKFKRYRLITSPFMATSDIQRHQIIRQAIARSTGGIADVAVKLWQSMASELISIIGQGGFNALYARSLHLASSQFPWLVPGTPANSGNLDFMTLKTSLDSQNAADAYQANLAFLIIFTDTLASLIGEPLTTRILNSAWGGDPEMERVEKESR